MNIQDWALLWAVKKWVLVLLVVAFLVGLAFGGLFVCSADGWCGCDYHVEQG